MARMQKASFVRPEEVRTFEKGKVELVVIGGTTFGLGTFQPGWRWSACMKPLVKTKSCEVPHLQYHVSGRLRVVMDNGQEEEFGPGEISLLPPGHDAWVVGNEPAVVLDIVGMETYGKKK